MFRRHIGQPKVFQHDCWSPRQPREVATTVRQDNLAVAVLADSVGGNQIHSCACCLMWIVNHRLGKHSVDEVGINWMGGVDKYHRRTLIELLPNTLDLWMAQIVIGITIAGEKSHPIGLELIKRIPNFLQRGIGIKDIRKRSKESVVLRGLVP